ncbi:hypothetical protein RRG08_039429 [Elysia crispata]|uniref:C-type lectin domain-containing protein n=1 Tax=Elysia crispata TaxID=231223 RepID=A0AAE1ABB4_9GAST|nr:hypothetical protein RRG08_039429 [Elysia crispata]
MNLFRVIQQALQYQYNSRNLTTCLALSTEKANYLKAVQVCGGQGGYVASAKTLEKLTLLLTLAQDRYFWVGLDDRKKNKDFVWLDDGSMLTPLQVQELFVPATPSWLATASGLRKSAQIMTTYPVLPLYACVSLTEAINPVMAIPVATPKCIAYS